MTVGCRIQLRQKSLSRVMDMTYRELYEYGRKQLEDAGIEEAALDARLLLEYISITPVEMT